MKNCEKIQDRFEEAYYGELSAASMNEFGEHLASCPVCKSEYAELKSTLDGIKQYSRPELGDDYWDRYWNRLSQSIESPRVRKVSLPEKLKNIISYLLPPSPATYYRPLLSGAALIVIGIFIGRTFLSDGGEKYLPVQTVTRFDLERSGEIHSRAINYFGRAKLVLLGIVNHDAETDEALKVSFDRQVQVSRDLVDESAILRSELSPRNDAVLLELISELEAVLLQTANLDDDYGIVDIRMIQQGAQRKALLFKIEIGESMLSNDADNHQKNPGRSNQPSGKTGGNLL